MDAPTRTDPPYVPIRSTRWAPHQKSPRWLLLAGALIVAGIVLVALVHKPSRSQQAGDLQGALKDMTADIQSCAGGVDESLLALHRVQAGENSAANIQATIKIARYGAANCSPANNELLGDLTQYQVTESLAGFHLATVVNDLVTWAFPLAQRVQSDVAVILRAQTPAARARATAALSRDQRALDAERAALDKIISSASTALSAHAHLSLPG